MRNRRVIGWGCLAVLVMAALATGGMRRPGAQAQQPSRSLVVTTGDVVVRVSETGTVEPLTRVDVKSKVAGRILRVAVEEGQPVRQGQLLAQIDPTEIRSQVNQIQAQIAAARARLHQAQTELRFQTAAARLACADAKQGLRTAEARLAQARRQSSAQPSLTQAGIGQAEANLRAAEAALAALLEATHPQTRADARAAFDQAQTNADNAGRQLRRLETLLARGYVAQNNVDDARRDYSTRCSQRDAAKERLDTLAERLAAERREAEARVAQMRAALDAARANAMQDSLREDDLTAAQAAHEQAQVAYDRTVAGRDQVAARQAEVDAARASVKQLEDQLEEIRVRLQDTTIRAPISGTVTKRYVGSGELITSGIATFSSGMPIVQIADLSRMRVVCQINEVDVAQVRVGQEAEVVLDAARGQRYPGRVVSVAPAAGIGAPGELLAPPTPSNIVKFLVRTEILRADGQLKPGMSAAVDIIAARRRRVLTLPLEAVDMSGRTPRVTLWRDGSPSTRDVRTGLQNDTVVELLSGVRQGDRVLPATYQGVARKRLNIQINPSQNGS